jgi:hypothetical protein
MGCFSFLFKGIGKKTISSLLADYLSPMLLF